MTTSPPTVLRYLAEHADKIARHPAAEEAWDEIESTLAAVETAIDTRPSSQYAGRCEVCKRDMYAQPGEDVVTCRPCGLSHQVQEQREHMLDEIQDKLVRSSEAARIIPQLSGVKVTRQDIDKWASVGLLAKHGTDEKDRPRYRVSEVIDRANQAAQERRRRAEKRARRGA